MPIPLTESGKELIEKRMKDLPDELKKEGLASLKDDYIITIANKVLADKTEFALTHLNIEIVKKFKSYEATSSSFRKEVSKDVAKQFAACRKAEDTLYKPWTQKLLGKLLYSSEDTIRRLLNLEEGGTEETITKVARILRIDPEELVGPDAFSLTPQQLWQELMKKATLTNLMGAVFAQPKISTLGARPIRPDDPFLRTVPLGSDIEFHLNFGKQGYLILLEREPSGVVVCLCPSQYAPNPDCTDELMVLPQCPPSPNRYFGATEAGCEQYIAVVCQELPPLDWLTESKKKALELDKQHLKELLEYLKTSPDAEAYHTEYSVTPQVRF